jgi:2-polyprenyl-3-methyl-5-hydroxy-6-metoxy-1,4-benzoquinol methylase
MAVMELGALYPSSGYYAYRRTGRPLSGIRETAVRLLRGYPPKAEPSFVMRLAVRAAARWLERRYYNVPPYRAGGRLLDVGAGAGDYVGLVGALGWEAVGVEAHEVAAAGARGAGLDVVTGDAAEILGRGALAGPFDVVRMHHVLEHLADPAGTLRSAAVAARRGATLYVAVPNAAGVPARLFGRYWYHWALPFHRSHFNVKTLRPLLRASGWRPTRAYFVSSPQGLVRTVLRWLRYELGIDVTVGDSTERWLGKAFRPATSLLDFLGVGDNLVVEAVKINEEGRAEVGLSL